MRIAEVTTLAHTPEDDEYVSGVMKSMYGRGKASLKPVRGGNLDGIQIMTRDWPLGRRTTLFLVDDDKPIGFATVEELQDDAGAFTDIRYVKVVFLLPEYRQRNLGTSLYRFLLNNGVALKPDNRQTVYAQKLWSRLARMPDVNVSKNGVATID